MTRALIAILVSCSLLTPALAEKADRDKPMQVEAQRMSVDDAQKIQTLEGSVVIIKGTLVLQADRVIVKEDEYGFQKSIAFAGKNGLAKFRQKMEGKEAYTEGEAERIEYYNRTDVAEFFHRAWVKRDQDQVKGDYIWYDALTEKYLVNAGEASRDSNAPPPRVRALIQPKNKTTAVDSSGESAPARLDLRTAPNLDKLPEH